MNSCACHLALLIVLATAPIILVGQPAGDVQQLIERFPGLDQAEEPSSLVADPMIRRETELVEVERRYTESLGNIVVEEQERFTKQLQEKEAARRTLDAVANAEEKERYYRDVAARSSLLDPMGDVLSTQAAQSKSSWAADVDKARSEWLKAKAEVEARRFEEEKANLAARRAVQKLGMTAAGVVQIENVRRDWVDTHDVANSADYEGVPTERDVIVIQFRPDVSIETIADVIQRYELAVRSGIAEFRIFVTRITDTDPEELPAVAVARLRRVVAAIAQEPAVASATQNVGVTGNIIPPPSNIIPPPFCWDWVDASCEDTAASKALRFPAAWNFSDAIVMRGNGGVRVAAIDQGFDVHEDLFYISACTNERNTHGNQVLGIIGAEWGNGNGIDGGTPFAQLIACAPGKLEAASTGQMTVLFSRLLWSFYRLLASSLRPQVVNVSLGYNWVKGFGEKAAPETRKDLQWIVRAQGIFVRAVMNRYKDVVVTSAAGNECEDPPHDPCIHLAKWSSPFNWAGLGDGLRSPNVFVVESIDKHRNPSLFSCVGGHIAAPGEAIGSTLTTRPPETMEETIGGLAHYGSDRGTSLAAPEVAAIIALMLAYNPSLKPDAVGQILGIGTQPRPIADAFRALILSRPDRAFVDLGDLDRDGVVGESDFVIFRTRLHEAEAHAEAFPREDLNGDGELSRNKTFLVPLLERELTDLEVLLAGWASPKPELQLLRDRLDE